MHCLEHGADANRPNFNGMTPLDIVWDTQNHPRIDRNYTRMRALLRKHCAIVIRKHVIGPPAEHNGRRIEHLAPHIASFVAPTEKFRPLASDDDSLRDSDSEDEMHHIDY